MMDIPAAIFKAECLKLMDQVAKTREPIVITKHGKPVAQLVPIAADPRSLFGYMKHSVNTVGDVVTPVEAQWSALSGDEDALYTVVSTKRRASLKRPRRK
jgi:prevent-host-death family protein